MSDDGMSSGDMATGPEPMRSDSKGWAAAAHLAPLTGFGFLAPLIIWLIKREEDPYVEWHGRQALNFQITWLIALIASAFSLLLLVGFILLPIVAVGGFILTIVAGVKAANGERWPYPLNIQFVK